MASHSVAFCQCPRCSLQCPQFEHPECKPQCARLSVLSARSSAKRGTCHKKPRRRWCGHGQPFLHCVDFTPLCCLFSTVLPFLHCVAFSPLCCLFSTVSTLLDCVAFSPLCCLFSTLLPFLHCVAFSPLCCLFSTVLPFLQCVAFSPLCFTLQTHTHCYNLLKG